MVDHLDLGMSYAALVRLIRAQAVATIQHAGIGSGGVRVHSGGFITIENGGLDVEGTATIVGLLTGSGTIDWWGPATFRGTLNVTGNSAFGGALAILGATTIGGLVTLNNDLSIGTGRIVVGNLVIQKAATYSAEIASSGILYLRGAGIRFAGPAVTETHLTVLGDLDVIGAKNFKMPHPTKPGHWLRHGSTESPVSGTEYTGRVRLDENGEGVIALPEYFEALNKPDGRTVQLTPVGRPFPVGSDDIVDGRARVYGDPGREMFWLVKAERTGGDFLLEERVPDDEEVSG